MLYEKMYFFNVFLFFFFSFFYLVPQDVQYIITETELTELEKILQDLKTNNKILQTDSQNLTMMQVKRLKRMLKKKEVTLNLLKAEIEEKQKKIDRIIAIIFLTAIFIIFLILINLPYLII